MVHDGRYILAETHEVFLCFEYVPNGSLGQFKGIELATFSFYACIIFLLF